MKESGYILRWEGVGIEGLMVSLEINSISMVNYYSDSVYAITNALPWLTIA
jgi:hypothetical protein